MKNKQIEDFWTVNVEQLSDLVLLFQDVWIGARQQKGEYHDALTAVFDELWVGQDLLGKFEAILVLLLLVAFLKEAGSLAKIMTSH